MGDALLHSLTLVLEPTTLGLMLLGVAIGFAVGILPGIGGPVTLALMLPFTFGMEPVEVFAFLLGMLVVTSTTGDITSVLFGIPGEATSAAAALDGYPLTRRGEGGRALGAVLFSSLLGSVFGALVLALSVPIVRPLVLSLGPPEFFVLTMVGLTFVIALSGKNVLKGFVMASLGLLVAMIGIDSQEGIPRYTFGQVYLWDGIGIVPLVIGLFGGAEVLHLMLSRRSIAGKAGRPPSQVTGVRQGVSDTLRCWPVVLQASAIGTTVGMLPGMGGSVAQFIAYGWARQSSRTPELFGKGAIDGVIASGATNNAKDGGALIPTIAFGIPGGAATAVLLSAFLIAGLDPGPEMLTTHVDVTFSMVWITVLANAVAVGAAFLLLRPLTRLTFISGPLLVPFLLLLLGLGAYTSTNNFNDVLTMLAASAVGVACIRWDWPRVPFLLTVVLGGIAERYLFLSYSLFEWSWLTRPVVLGLVILMVSVLFMPLVRRRRRRRREADTPTGTGRRARPASATVTTPTVVTERASDVLTETVAETTGRGPRDTSCSPAGAPFPVADVLIGTAVAGVFFAALLPAWQWSDRAGLFPRIITILGLALAMAHVTVVLTQWLRRRVVPVTPPAPVGNPPDADDDAEDVEYVFARTGTAAWSRALGWVAAFFAGLYLLGLLLTAPVFALLYLRFSARASWPLSVAYAAATAAVLYGGFGLALGLPIPSGVLHP